MLDLQLEQMKQSLCQCLPSKEMNLVPPIPEVRGAGSMHIGIYAYREHAQGLDQQPLPLSCQVVDIMNLSLDAGRGSEIQDKKGGRS